MCATLFFVLIVYLWGFFFPGSYAKTSIRRDRQRALTPCPSWVELECLYYSFFFFGFFLSLNYTASSRNRFYCCFGTMRTTAVLCVALSIEYESWLISPKVDILSRYYDIYTLQTVSTRDIYSKETARFTVWQ